LLRQLDAGHPVILRYYARTSFHAVLVVGYKDGGETLIIHDPKNQPNDSENMDHAMYSDITWQWLNERLDQVSLKRQLAPIIWIDEPMTSPKTLQTIHAPGADEKLGSAEGEFAFYWTNKDTKHKARMAFLHFRPSTPSGYEWVMKDKPIDVVPSSVDSIGIDLPAWNADFSPAKVTLITRVVAHGDFGAKEVYYKAQDITLPAAQLDSSNTKHVKVDIPLSEVRSATLADAQGRESISIQVYLRDFNESSSLRDKFEVSATISAAPFVSSVSPQSILPDQNTTITIEGSAFGKQPTAKSRVTISDQKADIISWSENQIKVKLGTNLEIGPNPVVVYTGQQYEYKSNTDVPVYVDKVRSCTGRYNFTAGGLPRWVNGKWPASKSLSMYISLGSPINDVGTVGTCDPPLPTARYSETVLGSYNTQDSKPTSITFNFAVSSEWSSGSCKYGEFYSGTFTGTYSGGGPFVPGHFSGTVSGDVRNYRKCGLATDYDEKSKFTASGDVGKVLSIQDDSGGD